MQKHECQATIKIIVGNIDNDEFLRSVRQIKCYSKVIFDTIKGAVPFKFIESKTYPIIYWNFGFISSLGNSLSSTSDFQE